MLITILVFLLILSLLVLIHEAGHYFVAKWFGIKVEEFGFGFPPKALGFKRGETMYTINWLPIGGFVKLYGEDDAGGGKVTGSTKHLEVKDVKRAFFARPVWQRALVVVAGVVMNAILAALIFYIYLGISGFKAELPLFENHTFFGVHQTNISDVVVASVAKNSPAALSGMKPLVRIKDVNGQEITSSGDFLQIVNANKGKPITVRWEDLQSKKISQKTLIPRVSPPKGQGAIGVSFVSTTVARLSYETPTERLFSGIVHPINLMVYNFESIGYLIKISMQQKTAAPLSEGVAGPVRIGMLVGTTLAIPDMKEKILQLLNLAGILSISLAFFNVLPIPALDGGRLFFILFEGVTGKKVNAKFENMVHTIGFVVLLTLMLFITLHEVFQTIKLPIFPTP